jgi:hypothetical protein
MILGSDAVAASGCHSTVRHPNQLPLQGVTFQRPVTNLRHMRTAVVERITGYYSMSGARRGPDGRFVRVDGLRERLAPSPRLGSAPAARRASAIAAEARLDALSAAA